MANRKNACAMPGLSECEIKAGKDGLKYLRKRTKENPYFAVASGGLHSSRVDYDWNQRFVEKILDEKAADLYKSTIRTNNNRFIKQLNNEISNIVATLKAIENELLPYLCPKELYKKDLYPKELYKKYPNIEESEEIYKKEFEKSFYFGKECKCKINSK